MAPAIASDQKTTGDIAGLFFCCSVYLFVRLFICVVACLFVCLAFFFLCLFFSFFVFWWSMFQHMWKSWRIFRRRSSILRKYNEKGCQICAGSPLTFGRDCLLVVFLFVSLGRMQWLQPLHRAKKKQATSLVCFLCFCCFFVCSFVYLFARLFLCVSYSCFLCFFLKFLCFLIIDVLINIKILTNILTKVVNFILRCVFKTHNFWGVISGSDNDCQCFYTAKTADFMIFL